MGKICLSGKLSGKWALAILATALSYTAPAQTCMVSGVVLSETNKIIPAAILKFTHKKESTEVRIGEDGMYYSPLLPEGSYLVDIYVGATLYRAERLHLRCTSETTYYNYRLRDTKANLYTDEYYPLSRIKAGEHVPQQPDNQQ
jgi:hypothetical protein